jgi:hypothetical protein
MERSIDGYTTCLVCTYRGPHDKFYEVDSKELTPKDNLDAMVEGLIEEWEQYIEQDNCGGTAKSALIGCVQDLKALRSDK